MVNKKNFLCLVLSLMTLPLTAAETNIIPQPRQVTFLKGEYSIKNQITAVATKEAGTELPYLRKQLKKFNITINAQSGDEVRRRGILLKLNPKITQPESYALRVSPSGIVIEGSDTTGVFYGIQSLLQEIRAANNNKKRVIPSMEIQDSPRYHWRGFMLDEARHFFGMEKVKQLLDLMAYYKLNKFHWHLTDDAGWRIEIKKYPKLGPIGGMGNNTRPNSREVRYYTQNEIREIVAYAKTRKIEIIPEIDMPGHATASNKAYPEYSGGGSRKHPNFTFNPGYEKTYQYLADILAEVADLFPTKYMNLGGDEVWFGTEQWNTNPHIQDLMKRENLKTLVDVEHYFHRRMSGVLKKMGKKFLGWDELVGVGLSPEDAGIIWWRHDKVDVLKKSLQKGYKTILCPRVPTYFGVVQHPSQRYGGGFSKMNALEKLYLFPDSDFARWNLTKQEEKLIMGIQAALWTERIATPQMFDYVTYPRLCALSEAAWSSEKVKNHANFLKRLEHAYTLFDTYEIYYLDYRRPSKHPQPEVPEIKK